MDVHLVSNVLQQTWPLSGLDFTDCIFGTSPHLFCSVYSLWNFQPIELSLPFPVEAHCKEKYSGIQGQGTEPFLWSFTATEKGIGRNTPRRAADELSQCETAWYSPPEFLQAQVQVCRTTWLIFPLWIGTALPALRFYTVPNLLHVLHHSQGHSCLSCFQDFINKQKEEGLMPLIELLCILTGNNKLTHMEAKHNWKLHPYQLFLFSNQCFMPCNDSRQQQLPTASFSSFILLSLPKREAWNIPD